MFELIELALWFLAAILCFVLMIMFIVQYKRRETLSRPFFLGLAVFMASYGTARLIENIRRYFIGYYGDVFDAWLQGEQITGINFWLRFLYYFIAWLGIAVMYFNIEKYIFKKNRYILTIFSILEGTVSIVNYFFFNDLTYWASVGLFFVAGFFMPLLFVNLARKTPSGPVRNGCIMIGIGISIFVIAVMIDLPETAYFLYVLEEQNPEELIRLLAPILLICGLSIFSLGFKRFFPDKT
ncbi:MAG: hypothetical protein ACOC35_02090 [Promethearchaeia archaeon]